MSGGFELLDLWGKAGSASPESGAKSHPALYHMIDVGMVGWAHLNRHAGTAWACAMLAPFPGDGASLLGFLAALHDYGKLVPPFQHKRPDLYPEGEPAPPEHGSADHGSASTVLLTKEVFVGTFGWDRDAAMQLALVLGGHHGRMKPFDPRWRATAHKGSARWVELRAEAVGVLLSVFLGGEAPRRMASLSPEWLLTFAGWVSVIDWIGSIEEVFEFAGDQRDPMRYADASRARAARALDRVGWKPLRADAREIPFARLFPATPEPRPVQAGALAAIARLAREPPFLVILEAPMGCGKTELALAVADRWIHRHRLQGLYYALPTQATSNQMFDRVKRFLDARFAGSSIELHLLHSNRLFHEEYTDLPEIRGIEPEDERAIGAVRASEWFRGRKRGLLSSFAVGTIDQALLSVLQVKHHFVRLFGLAGKVLVLDEVHAYDAYMTKEIERLLEWARRVGTSVILLSATLPTDRRSRFLRAFGLEDPSRDKSYPALSLADAASSRVVPLPPGDDKRVVVRAVAPDGIDGLVRDWLTRLGSGGTAAWISNTVDAAQEAWRRVSALAAEHDVSCEVMLFHARMPLRRRLAVEDAVLAGVGKDRADARAVFLVATQVVEQSLDLDFDALLSELCPIDLLLQRMGRLHRHERNRRAVDEARLHWIDPEVGGDGVARFGHSGFVYDPYILLKTRQVLSSLPYVSLPGDLRSLIEAVYVGPDESIDFPTELRPIVAAHRDEWNKRISRETGMAGYALIPPPEHYDIVRSEQHRDDDEIIASTRLDDRPSVQVVCLFARERRLFLDRAFTRPFDLGRRPNLATTKELVLSSVSLSRRDWVDYFENDVEPPSSWARTPLLRRMKPCVFDSHGVLETKAGMLRIDDTLGLVYG